MSDPERLDFDRFEKLLRAEMAKTPEPDPDNVSPHGALVFAVLALTQELRAVRDELARAKSPEGVREQAKLIRRELDSEARRTRTRG